MKTGVKVNVSGFLKKMKEFPELLAREKESILKQEARALCIEYGRVSGPGEGLTEGPLDKARRQVEGDVRRSYLNRQRGGPVYEAIRRRSPQLAAAYWHAYKKKDERAQTRIMRDAGFQIGALDPGVHKSARTGPGGSVPSSFHATEMVSAPQLRVYVRKQQARIGMAKAGWLCAAKALGGRIRTRYVKGYHGAVNVEVFPKSVRTVARKFPALGGARILSAKGMVKIEIFTYAGHARKALGDDAYHRATDAAQEKLSMNLRRGLEELRKKRFESRAA